MISLSVTMPTGFLLSPSITSTDPILCFAINFATSRAEGLSSMSTVTTAFWGIISLTTLMLYRRSSFQDKYVPTCLPLVCRTEDSQSGYLSVTLSFMIGASLSSPYLCKSRQRLHLYPKYTPSKSLLLSQVPQYRSALHTGTIFLDHTFSSHNVSNNARLDEVFTVFTNTIRNMLPPLATLIHYHLKFVNFYFELPAC